MEYNNNLNSEYNNDLFHIPPYIEENNNYDSNYDNNLAYDNDSNYKIDKILNKIFSNNSNKNIALNEEDLNINYNNLNENNSDIYNNNLKLNEDEQVSKLKNIEIKILNKKINRNEPVSKKKNEKIPSFTDSPYRYFFKVMLGFIKDHKSLTDDEKTNLTENIKNIREEVKNLYTLLRKDKKLDKDGIIIDYTEKKNMQNFINNASDLLNEKLKNHGLPPYEYKTLDERRQFKDIPSFNSSKYISFFSSTYMYIIYNYNSLIQNIQNLKDNLLTILQTKHSKALELYNICKTLNMVDKKGNITDYEKAAQMENIKSETTKTINNELAKHNLPSRIYKPRK